MPEIDNDAELDLDSPIPYRPAYVHEYVEPETPMWLAPFAALLLVLVLGGLIVLAVSSTR